MNFDPDNPPSREAIEANFLESVAIGDAANDARIVAKDLRDELAVLVMTPVAQRDPAVVSALTTEGIVMTVQTLGERDPEVMALATECGNLALAATQQRLASVFAGG